MKNLFVCTIEAFLLIGLLAIVGSGQSAPDASAVNARAGTVTALLENTTDKSVLFWTSDNRPQTLADVGKFRVAPGTKRKMVVNVSASGQVKFTVSSGPPPDKSSILGRHSALVRGGRIHGLRPGCPISCSTAAA
jgi:hypothetical protein